MQQWWWSPVMEVAVVGDVEGMKKSNKEEKKSYNAHLNERERGRENSVLIGVKRENLSH
jgi:hypothetical protein